MENIEKGTVSHKSSKLEKCNGINAGSSPVSVKRVRLNKRKPNGWECEYCKEHFDTKQQLYQHKHLTGHLSDHQGPMKGKGKNQFIKAKELGLQKPEVSQVTKEKLALIWKGKHLPEEMRKKISETQKKNIQIGKSKGWMSCHSSNRSWQEIEFQKIIQNEFEDKNVIEQYRFFCYALDFAWVEKKKCIEIDGKQHETSSLQKESDIRKDNKLKENGWKVLRIKFSDLSKDTQKYIKIAKQFIDS